VLCKGLTVVLELSKMVLFIIRARLDLKVTLRNTCMVSKLSHPSVS
jgi:hypothetical protein